MPNRYYSSAATQTSLASGITNVATTLVVGSTTGFPTSFPYTLILDQDTASEEAVTVSAAAGVSLTVIRGVDGTSAVAHSAGAAVVHGVTARDFAEPQAHMETTAAHGATGAVVGTTNTQTLSNKTLTTPTLTVPVIADYTSATHDHSATNKGSKLLQANTHQSPDTDSATGSLHHTIGASATQAAAGNHTHTVTDISDSGWTAFTPSYTNFTLGSGSQIWRYKQIGKTVFVKGRVTLSSSTVSGTFEVGFPATAEASIGNAILGEAHMIQGSTSESYFGIIRLFSATRFFVTDRQRSTVAPAWAATEPVTWASFDEVWFSYTYEAA